MEFLKTFFRKTYSFWIVSRIILIILFLLAVVDQKFETKIGFVTVSGIVIFYIVCMCYLTIVGFLKKDAPKIVHIFTGGFSIFFGLILIYLLLHMGKERFVILALSIPIWLVLYGTWEIVNKLESVNKS